jgi:hypothetical protein
MSLDEVHRAINALPHAAARDDERA